MRKQKCSGIDLDGGVCPTLRIYSRLEKNPRPKAVTGITVLKPVLPGLAAVSFPTSNATSTHCLGPSSPHQVVCLVGPLYLPERKEQPAQWHPYCCLPQRCLGLKTLLLLWLIAPLSCPLPINKHLPSCTTPACSL